MIYFILLLGNSVVFQEYSRIMMAAKNILLELTGVGNVIKGLFFKMENALFQHLLVKVRLLNSKKLHLVDSIEIKIDASSASQGT